MIEKILFSSQITKILFYFFIHILYLYISVAIKFIFLYLLVNIKYLHYRNHNNIKPNNSNKIPLEVTKIVVIFSKPPKWCVFQTPAILGWFLITLCSTALSSNIIWKHLWLFSSCLIYSSHHAKQHTKSFIDCLSCTGLLLGNNLAV